MFSKGLPVFPRSLELSPLMDLASILPIGSLRFLILPGNPTESRKEPVRNPYVKVINDFDNEDIGKTEGVMGYSKM